MAKTLVGALTLASLLPSALAFQNTSPFFLFSTADLNLDGKDVEVAQSATLAHQLTQSLTKCPSAVYFLFRQDGVSSTDYLDDRYPLPNLASFMTGGRAEVKTTMTVSDVLGSVDTGLLSKHLQTACGAQVLRIDTAKNQNIPFVKPHLIGAPPQVIEVVLPEPPVGGRATGLSTNDHLLDLLLGQIGPSVEYTVVYTTTPRPKQQPDSRQGAQNEHPYEVDDALNGALQMELKRDTTFSPRADKRQQAGLFERYQYFTPGLFMAFSAMVPLVLILVVGINALANMEVSYFAFSKEMGPTTKRQ